MLPPIYTFNSMDTLSLAFPVGALLFMIILFLFQYADTPSFLTVLWITVPLVTYLVSGLVLMGAQASTCGSIQAGKAFLGALPTATAAAAGLGLASLAICRIPIASVMAPLFMPVKKGCCVTLTLEAAENQLPMIKGMANGFYVFFAVMFGMVWGAGSALVC